MVELLRDEPPAPLLVDAAGLAARLGMSRSWVYAHADELGAIRLPSSGGRSALRFDPAEAVQRLTAVHGSKRSRRVDTGRGGTRAGTSPAADAQSGPADVELLPVGPVAARRRRAEQRSADRGASCRG